MKIFGGLLALFGIIAVGRCQSVGLETYDITFEPAGMTPLLSCSESDSFQGAIYSISTTNTEFKKYTLTNSDFEAVPFNWTEVEGVSTFPQCAEAADAQGGFMFHFHEGTCEVSLEYGLARDAEPTDLEDTRTVYINENLPAGACQLKDGNQIADDTCALIDLKGCTNLQVVASCSSGTASYDPDVDIDLEYFNLEDGCAALKADCTVGCSTGLDLCYPSSVSAITAFVDEIKGQIGEGPHAALELNYDTGNTIWKWNNDFTQASDGPEWAAGEPAAVPTDEESGFVSADGLVDEACTPELRQCCMIPIV